MEIGIDSFAAFGHGNSGNASDSSKALAELLERIDYADKSGLDVFGIGEHYRKEFLDSAPAVILAAAAARTKKIRLTSAVTVLSAADPVRAFQSFSTIDLISGGRAEMVVGRGSFTESFPLFGLDLNDYDELFAEKLKVGLHSLGYVAKNSEKAIEDYYPGYAETFTRIGKERGWPSVNRARFDDQVGPRGALVIGSPDEVAEKILRHSESLGGISRFTFQMDNAGLTHGQL